MPYKKSKRRFRRYRKKLKPRAKRVNYKIAKPQINRDVIIYRPVAGSCLPRQFFTSFKVRQRCILSPIMFTNGQPNQLIYIPSNNIAGTIWSTPFGQTGLSFPTGYGTSAGYNEYARLVNANMYTSYCVYAQGIKVSIVPQDQSDSLEFSVTSSGVNTAPSGMNTNTLDSPYTKSMKVVPSITASKTSPTIYMKTNTGRCLGISENTLINDESLLTWSAAYNSTPILKNYWVINVGTLDGVNPTNPLLLSIEMTAYVKLFNLSQNFT